MNNSFYENCLVTPNYSFEREQFAFPQYRYPKPGMLLTVLKSVKDELNNLMFWFSDFKMPIPLAGVCFDIVQSGDEGEEILDEVFKIINNLP